MKNMENLEDEKMNLAKGITWIGLIAMTLAIGNGFINGDFFVDGAELLANPWGLVSMVDLYVGFVVFSMWIAFREKSIPLAAIWIVAMMILGNFTACLYVLVGLYQSKGDWAFFFMGHRAK